MTVAIQNNTTIPATPKPTKASKSTTKPTLKQLTDELIQLSLRVATIKRELDGSDLPDENEDVALVYQVFEEEVRLNVASVTCEETEAIDLNQQFNLLFNNTF